MKERMNYLLYILTLHKIQTTMINQTYCNIKKSKKWPNLSNSIYQVKWFYIACHKLKVLLLYSQGIFVLLLLSVKSRFFHWPWPMTFHWGVFELGGATFNFPPTTSHATPIKILTFFQKSWRTLKDGQCCVAIHLIWVKKYSEIY